MRGRRLARGAFAAGAVAALLAGGEAPAGTLDEELGTDDAKIAERVKDSNVWGGDGSPEGTGGKPHLPSLGAPPKRVALVSFYAWDCGNEKHSAYNTVMTWKRTIDVLGVDALAQALYDVGIGPLKEAFAAHRMELLTPTEFLDTDAKRSAYQAFKIEQSAMAKFAGLAQKSDKDHLRMDGAPAGYRVLKVITSNNPEKNDFTLAAKGGMGSSSRGSATTWRRRSASIPSRSSTTSSRARRKASNS